MKILGFKIGLKEVVVLLPLVYKWISEAREAVSSSQENRSDQEGTGTSENDLLK